MTQNQRGPEEIYGDLFTEQLRLEDHYRELAKAAAQHVIDSAKAEMAASQTGVGRKLVSYGFEDALANVKTWLHETLRPKRGTKPGYITILKKLRDTYEHREEELLGLLTVVPLSALINHIARDSIILSDLAHIVAGEIQAEARMEAFIKSIPERKVEVLLKGMAERADSYYKAYYARRTMKLENFEWSRWDPKDAAHMAFQLLELVIDGSGFFERHVPKSARGDEQLVAVPTDWLLKTWQRNEARLLENVYRNCPMVIPPKPWEGLKDGGYYGTLNGRHSLLRSDSLRYGGTPNAFTKAYLERLEEVDLSAIKQAVNAIQETPWAINKEVLAVVEEIAQRGGEIGDIPRMDKLPQLPELTGDFTEEQLKEHRKKKWEIYKKDITRATLAARTLANLKTARAFAKYDHIYFPHNMDFRGRVYPIPSFGPQGDDVTRGLLLFADPPACNSMEDIEWLMVHGANLAGIDKVSFEDRKQWVRDNEKHILASAEDPLGYLWWAEQDDSSIQFLAFCLEWAKWKAWEKAHGTPDGFVTGIPVAFDGTCSGLQHYSALLRDPVGGAAVNLVPDDHPHDIYQEVADKVIELLKRDAIHGTIDEPKTAQDGTPYIKYGTKSLSQQWLAYGVTRKVTKRSVMTLPYGSREYGFRDQILEDTIKEALKDGRGGMFVAPAQAAGYMARLIWEVVQQVVVKAVHGMNYLQKLARMVCKRGQVITWTTPMGLPVQQAYMEEKTQEIRLRLHGAIRRRLFATQATGNIKKTEQVSGIAPNFIHSLDAAHLQLTVLNANEKGIKHFALIHDSYGAPVAQAGEMFQTVREAFLQLYTEHDPLGTFTSEMGIYLEEADELPPLPRQGKLKIEEVLESLYMFA
ncbi:DNA-directed RNA polymerase [Anaeroselena agilis]|uniref:DNA-directed RNA polymerase n=1 Tax=Anaeroselena agilis TaxID=3063788 RepID=A0ABU3NUX7_9FIRM|nr:hypothetical protein [Selenomonadales bacterium 4137-cl]